MLTNVSTSIGPFSISMNADRDQPVQVLVFKTNVKFKKDQKRIERILNENRQILRWNMDRDDRDKVLRIECGLLPPAAIIDLITQAGYCCEELPD